MSPVRRLDEPYRPESDPQPLATEEPASAPLASGPLSLSPTTVVAGGVIRVPRGTPASLSKTFFSGTTEVDPTTVSVTVTNAVGTQLVTGNAAGTGAGARTFSLTTAETALLDTLTVSWASPTAGTLTSTVEVVGGFVFSLPQLRVLFSDETAYPDEKLAEARTYAEEEIENALGYALVPRYALETVSAYRGHSLRLRPYVRTIRSITVSGTVLTDLSALTVTGQFVGGYWWPTGTVVVGYEYGLDRLPLGATRAALSLATEFLGGGSGTIDPRAERLITDDGTIVYGSTSGGQFRAAGVNEWVAANRFPVVA